MAIWHQEYHGLYKYSLKQCYESAPMTHLSIGMDLLKGPHFRSHSCSRGFSHWENHKSARNPEWWISNPPLPYGYVKCQQFAMKNGHRNS